LETSGGVLSTVDMVVQRHDGPRWLRDHDDDDVDEFSGFASHFQSISTPGHSIPRL